MQAVKVGWAGQTFALARCSDSQGKRTRNRISKEERKSLVKTFIKTYQKSNDGNFPSLNLTHKEVGGSFYTVREIVREIIQENRILGPGDSASKVLVLQDCDDHSFVDPLSLDGVSNFSSAVNGRTAEGSQIEGEYSYNQHSIILEGVVDSTVNKSSVSINSVLNAKGSDETVASPSGRYIFSQNLDVDPFVNKSNLSCVDRETSWGNGTLQTKNEHYVQVSGKSHVHSSKASTKVEAEYQVGISMATAARSSVDVFLNPNSEVDASAEISPELLSSSEGATGSSSVEFSNSTPPSSCSDEVVKVEIEVCMNDVSSGEVLKSSTVAAVSDITLTDAAEMPGAVALKIFDTKPEEHLSFTQIRAVPADAEDSLHLDFNGGDFLDSSKEIELAAVTEKYTEIVSENAGSTEDDQSKGVASNIIVDEGVASSISGISDLSSLEFFEGKVSVEVEAIPADKAITRKEITTSENSKELLAPIDTLPKPVPNSTGASENISVRSDRQLTVDASKPKKVPQEDPFWDAIKSFFAAFVKFWTE